MGQYADVNGVRIYYEEHGSGDPILLLHGGLAGTYVWDAMIPGLADSHHAYVPENRGRGRSPDVDGPITYQSMADDIMAFLEGTVGEPATLIGGSDGGIVGLLVAGQRPELLRKLVTIGANFHRDGLAGAAMWLEGSPGDEDWAGPRQRYEEVSPDGPDHFPVVFEKLRTMWRTEPNMTVDDLAKIPVPVLVVAGDDDVVAHEHTVAMYEALPQGQLAIIPGASHGVFMEKADLLNRLILDFMAEEGPPQTLLPQRRR